MTLENLLRTLNNYHKLHGVTILFNDPKPWWVSLRNYWLLLSPFLYWLITFLGTFERFSNNDQKTRMFNYLIVMCISEMFGNEFVFWLKRKKALELVNWCRRVEAQRFETFNKPIDWFHDRREVVLAILRLVSTGMFIVWLLVTIVGAAVQTFLFRDGYHLPVSFQLKFFSEKDSFPKFLVILSIFGVGSWFLLTIFYFGFSIFILLSNYIIGQIDLIKYYIGQLDLYNTRKLRYQLGVVVTMHLDALRTIKKLSSIYLATLKSKEFSLYIYVSLMVFGKEMLTLMILPALGGLVSVVGLYCYACENMMEAEQYIRNAYYELEWYKAPVASRKLLVLAMQEPEKIRFGRVFSYDYASLARFLLLIQRAYNFSLMLKNISMK